MYSPADSTRSEHFPFLETRDKRPPRNADGSQVPVLQLTGTHLGTEITTQEHALGRRGE